MEISVESFQIKDTLQIRGAGVVTKEDPRMNLVGDPFYTDGLRAVLFFESRPNALSDIELLQWEFPSGSVLKKN